MQEASLTDCKACGKQFTYAPTQRKDGTEVLQNIPYKCGSCKRAQKNRGLTAPVEDQVWSCANCGESFTGRKKRYCTHRCARKAQESRYKIECRCERCETKFTCNPPGRKYCTKTCREVAARDRQLSKRGDIIGREYVYNFTKTAATGAIAEKLFDVWCISNGIEQAMPTVEANPAWDRLIKLGNEWKTVQIKGTSKKLTLAAPRIRPQPGVDIVASVHTGRGEVIVLWNDPTGGIAIPTKA